MTAGTGGNPLAFLTNAAGLQGSKFTSLNVKRVYFGNWLYPPRNLNLLSVVAIIHKPLMWVLWGGELNLVQLEFLFGSWHLWLMDILLRNLRYLSPFYCVWSDDVWKTDLISLTDFVWMILIYFPEDLKLHCFRVFKECADRRWLLKGSGSIDQKNISVFLPTDVFNVDNPRDYADNEDARKYDPRLRGPVDRVVPPSKRL